MNKPRLLDRIRYTLDFWKHGTRYMVPRRADRHITVAAFTWADVGSGHEEKAMPFIWPEWRLGRPEWKLINYQAYAQEGFNENAVIYAAIMYKVKAITTAPLRAYKGTMDEPELLPADDPLQQLVARPNRHMSWSEFQGIAEVYFNVAGNCYIYAHKEDRDQKTPDSLWLLRPDRVYIVPHPDHRRKALEQHPNAKRAEPDGERKQKGDGIDFNSVEKKLKGEEKKELITEKVLGFLYVPEGKSVDAGIPFLPEQIIHIKLPNPLDPLDGLGYGLSPLSPAARSADVDNQITKYLKLFFDKGAMPPGLVTYDVPIDEGDVADTRERFAEIYGSSENWWKPVVLGEGGKYQRLSLGFDEMGFEEIDSRNETRMTGPFGVPPILIGTRIGLNRATYANYEEARKAFWEDTMTPELRWFEVEYQYYLQGDSGEFVMFDLSKVPALMPTQAEKRDLAERAFKSGMILRNEARAVFDFNPIEGGDVYLVPMTLVEIRPQEVEEEPPEGETQEGMPEAEEQAEEEEAKELKQSRMTAEQKAAFWKAMDRQAVAWEGKFGEAAEKAFKADLREILAIVGKAKARAKKDKATVAWSLALLSVQDYLAMAGRENWRETFTPVIMGLIVERGEQLNVDFGMTFDVRNLFAERWFEEYTLTFAQPINATTEEAMSALFQQAMAEGWSVPTMQKHLEQLFQQWMEGNLLSEDFEWFEQRMPAHRRERIARTETIRASNAGSEALYRGWGVQMKEWYSTPDSRTREAHRIGTAWGHPPVIVPINASFDVGGESLMYPGDPQGSPENTINCRCTVVPVV